jgi:hypothetical protein
MHHQMFLTMLTKKFGVMRLIVCVTKYDKVEFSEDKVELKNLALEWLEKSQQEMISTLQIDSYLVRFCCVCINQKRNFFEVEDLLELLAPGLIVFQEVDDFRKENNIIAGVHIEVEEEATLDGVSKQLTEEIKREKWFQDAALMAFGMPAAALLGIVAIPFAIAGISVFAVFKIVKLPFSMMYRCVTEGRVIVEDDPFGLEF